MNDDEGCIGCFLREITYSGGESAYTCKRKDMSDIECPCSICLIKGMCKHECQEFLDYNGLIGYGKEFEEEE